MKLNQSRRKFIKGSAVAAAALSVHSVLPKQAQAKTLGWSNGMQINPTIDNLRVVVVNDSTMISGSNVIKLKVHANMDKMAIALAQKSTAAEAWKTIFQKASSKSWSSLQVKIKTNCIEPGFIPRPEIIEKICLILKTINSTNTSDPGIPYANMTVLDDKDLSGYSGKLPAGVNIASNSQNLGTPDIFVNVTISKGHVQADKQFTLTSKNLYGIFGPSTGPEGCGDMSYMLSLVKRDEILGGSPVRCQLNIVDSLWAMINGPTFDFNGSTTQTNRIAMGTFGPAVDFLVAKKIRNDIMNQGHDINIINRFMDDFGYSSQKASLNFVDALTYTPIISRAISPGITNNTVLFSSGGVSLNFSINSGKSTPYISIFSPDGRLVRQLQVPANRVVLWNTRDEKGAKVSKGNYAIQYGTGANAQTQHLLVF